MKVRKFSRSTLARLCGMRTYEVSYALHKKRKGLSSSLAWKLQKKMWELGIEYWEVGPR